MDINALIETKTFWVGVGGILNGIIGLITNEYSAAVASMLILNGLQAITLRDTLLK